MHHFPRSFRTCATVVTVTLSLALAPAAAHAQDAAPPAPPTDAAPPTALARLATIDAATSELAQQIAAGQVVLADRRTALAAANTVLASAEAEAEDAGVRAEQSQTDVDSVVVAAWSGARTSRLSAVLVSDGPQDLLDRMGALALVGEDGAARLAQANARREAASQATTRASAELVVARAAEGEAITEQQQLVQRRSELERQSTEATALLEQVRADVVTRDDPQVAASQQAREVRASRASAVRAVLYAQPTTGRVTSSFGSRGGSQHGGTDIANAIGTPVYSVADGVVVDAGPASGFGLWVRIRHDDGTITVYGHIDSYSVSVGQSVSAGEQIARMGNRGQSTGPHLHIEVVTSGGGKVDALAWLSERGVPL